MGPLDVSLNGAPTGEGFLIVSGPAQPLPGTLSLRTMDASEGDVTLRPAHGSAAALSITPSPVHVSGEPTTVQVVAGAASTSHNDAAIEILEGDAVVARLELTVLAEPRVRFSGRFQCRLATNADAHDHEWGTSASSFRMYAVQGPLALDPNVATDEPPLDRIIRFHDGVAVRPLCDPIKVGVKGIEADVGGSRLLFETGDPLIDLPVRLGPSCRFEEQDGAFSVPGLQPIADFRFEIGSVFAGGSEPAAKRLNPDPNAKPPSNAPYADGAFFLDAIGPWKPKDFGFLEDTWLEHAQVVVATKLTDLRTREPADGPAHRIWQRRVLEHESFPGGIISAMRRVQRFTGSIDRQLMFLPAPEGVLAYLRTLSAIPFFAEFFNFDTDCQSGTVTGTLGGPAPRTAVPEAARLSPAEARGASAAGNHPP